MRREVPRRSRSWEPTMGNAVRDEGELGNQQAGTTSRSAPIVLTNAAAIGQMNISRIATSGTNPENFAQTDRRLRAMGAIQRVISRVTSLNGSPLKDLTCLWSFRVAAP